MATMNESELQEALREVLRRSTMHPEFRNLALERPAAAFGQVAPKSLPKGVEFRFVDNSGPVKTFVLPDPVATGELSEAELDEVAGGCDIASCLMTL